MRTNAGLGNADCGLKAEAGWKPAIQQTGSLRYEAAFTMVEIAFSLAIVAFALVAIMGVLPTGMTVQKDNREDTLINQDGMFWLESMRSGSHGIEDLTNYVEQITISNRLTSRVWVNTFDRNSQIISGEQIIGLLTTPKYHTNGATANWVTNTVTARVRAINGPAAEKGNPTNEFTFRYEMRSEVTPVWATPPGGLPLDGEAALSRALYDASLAQNLNNIRLTMRWPLFQQGSATNWGVGRNRRSVRAMMNGRLAMQTNTTTTNFFIEPNNYVYVRTEEL